MRRFKNYDNLEILKKIKNLKNFLNFEGTILLWDNKKKSINFKIPKYWQEKNGIVKNFEYL